MAALYDIAVIQARNPVFYQFYKVPDTVDGRFDMICLHVALLMDRLRRDGRNGEEMAQVLFDVMFREMDIVLREMGIGDLGVPKHIKRMMKGLHGRAVHYAAVTAEDDTAALRECLQKNLYGTAREEIDEKTIGFMASYVVTQKKKLDETPLDRLMKADFEFEMPGDSNDGSCDTGMVAQI